MDRKINKKLSNEKIYISIVVAIIIAVVAYNIFSSSTTRVKAGDVTYKTVQKGALSLYVIGNGEVMPKEVDYLASKTDGELVAVHVKSGDEVKKDQVLFLIHNDELISELENSRIAVVEAENAMNTEVFELKKTRLEIEADVLRAESAHLLKVEEYLAYKKLREKPDPPISNVLFQQVRISEAQFKKISDLENVRLKSFMESMKSQINQYQARIDLANVAYERISKRVAELELKARVDGIVQDVDLKVGQYIKAGTVVGKVSNPQDIFIRLKVSAVQGHRLEVGQSALITLRNEERRGKVVRVDPNVKGTTMDVDVELDDKSKLPNNMFVTGKIVVKELEEALYVEAPLTGAIENGTSMFYQLSEDGSNAELKKVKTGLLSAGKIQILGTLNAGDKIVVSDTGKFRAMQRVVLN